MRRFGPSVGLVCLLLAIGCTNPDASDTSEVPVVYTTFYPMTYFTQSIGGEQVRVVCPLPDGEDPIHWMPSPEIIEAYQAADLIVINGAGLERWVDRVSLSESKRVDTASRFEKDWIKYQDAMTHSHGATGKHAHEGIDGHTWLDPQLAKRQTEPIARALSKLLPEQAETFQSRHAELVGMLDELDRSLREVSERMKDMHLVASHPAYQYVARRYGWNVTSFDLDPAVMPDDATLAALQRTVDATSSQILLWESHPNDAIARRLEESLGLKSVVFSPCETLDAESIAAGEDYLSLMRANISRLREAVEP